MNTQNIKVENDDKTWEVLVKAEIAAESLATFRTTALSELQKTAKLDGFRPGHVPVDKIIATYGEPAIMRIAAERAIEHALPEILVRENIMIIESPKVTTDSPVMGQPLSFTARAPRAPRVVLADYKKIRDAHKKTTDVTPVTDAERDEALTHIRRERVRIDKIEAGMDASKASEESRAIDTKNLPELDDAFAISIGYEGREKFVEALRTNMQTEKEMQASQKRRGALLDELVKKSEIHYPLVLREYELDDLQAQFTEDLKRSGVTIEQYLKDVNKTPEALRKDFETGADTRVKVRLLLTEIGRIEHIDPTDEVIDHELTHAIEGYPKSDPQSLRANIIHAIRNEMTIRFLEGNTEAVGHTSHDHS
jgi:FKBP-type peptidyl-prolyl cis-trans isomerase (trigger factor)